ncbi:Der GTPase-activating protein YihI [Enterobacteriaceae bacterium LUAb1]
MKQPARAGQKAGLGKSKRERRESLNQQARERKRDKKHRGHKAGSRANPVTTAGITVNNHQKTDTRIGSKKPVPLHVDTAEKNTIAPVAATEKNMMQTPQEELFMLENSERLDTLLNRLEEGEMLLAEDQVWLDQTLERIDVLMEMLGISLDDEEQSAEHKEDMYRLLKGGH